MGSPPASTSPSAAASKTPSPPRSPLRNHFPARADPSPLQDSWCVSQRSGTITTHVETAALGCPVERSSTAFPPRRRLQILHDRLPVLPPPLRLPQALPAHLP